MEEIDKLVGDPVIGQTYLVKSIMAKVHSYPSRPCPIVGIGHSDKDYGFGDEFHWHIDFRFLPTKDYRIWLKTMKDDDAKLDDWHKAWSVLRYIIDKDNVNPKPKVFKHPFEFRRKMP